MGLLSTIFDWLFPGTEEAAIDYLETVAEEPHHEQAEFYHPSPVKRKTIGIKSASLHHRSCDTNYLNTNDLTHTIFDTTTRIDAARILLTNSTGAARYLTGCAIRGLAVKSFSGGAGWVHDSFVDYESIARSGERKFKVANDFVVTKDQVEKLADYHWKDKKGKHIYNITIPGCWLWIEQGEWYTLQGGGAGEDEHIDSTVRCESVDIEQSAGSLGTTTVVFKEVEEAWSKSSTAVAHFTSSGNLLQHPNSQEIVIASSTYIGVADYYCDGTADEVEINKAINWLAGSYNGGWVRLTEGQFNTAAAISPKANIVIQGRGWDTIIEKNGNFSGIHIVGGDGTEIENVILSNFKITRNVSDTNSQVLINAGYADNLILNQIWCYNSDGVGAYLYNCDNSYMISSQFTDCDEYGLYIRATTDNPCLAKIIANSVLNNGAYGIILFNTEHSTIEGNIIKDNSALGIDIVSSNYDSIIGNICENNGTYAAAAGIFLEDSDHNIISGNICENNNQDGIRIHDAASDRNIVTGNRSTGNTNNFVDNGTNTTVIGNDFV